MGSNNQPVSKVFEQNSQKNKIQQKVLQKSQQKETAKIQQIKQERAQFSLPQGIQSKQKVRNSISKYNDKIEIEMKKPYFQQFLKMRQKILKNMEGICKQNYFDQKKKSNQQSKEFKQCMQSAQNLITEQDQRMQTQFGVKLFLLADKCLIQQERRKLKLKQKPNSSQQIQYCVSKLLKYRSLNMQMHLLKMQLARQML